MARESMQQTEHDRETSIGAARDTAGVARRDRKRPEGVGRLDPRFSRMERLASEMDRLLDGFGFRGLGSNLGFADAGIWTPQVEVSQRGDKLVVRADIPGLKKEDVHVDVEDDILTIRGERREEHTDSDEGYYRSERSYGEFYRAVPLPEGVDVNSCDARYHDGVLEVTLPMPKAVPRKTKQVKVR